MKKIKKTTLLLSLASLLFLAACSENASSESSENVNEENNIEENNSEENNGNNVANSDVVDEEFELTKEKKRELKLELFRIEYDRIEFDSEEEKEKRLNEIFEMLGTTKEEYEAEQEKMIEESLENMNSEIEEDPYDDLSLREKLDLIKSKLTEKDEEPKRMFLYNNESYENFVQEVENFLFQWTMSHQHNGFIAFPEGAERVKLIKDTLTVAYFKGHPATHMESEERLEVLVHEHGNFTVFYMVNMEFEDGSTEEILIEQRYTGSKNGIGNMVFFRGPMQIEHQIEDWYPKQKLNLNWF